MRRALLALALLLPLGLASAPAQANPYDDYKALNNARSGSRSATSGSSST